MKQEWGYGCNKLWIKPSSKHPFPSLKREFETKTPSSYFCNFVPDNTAFAIYLKHYIVHDTEWGEKNDWYAKNVTLQRETVTRSSVILRAHFEVSQLETDSLIFENRGVFKVDIEKPQYFRLYFIKCHYVDQIKRFGNLVTKISAQIYLESLNQQGHLRV